jgi:adenylate cyclase
MAEVFVSYARPDEPLAERVSNALRAEGYSVWRDDQLPAHKAYADVILERLKAAAAVVVLWSADAAKSQWVRSEADAARQAGTLIQAAPPMPFDQIQCANLDGWNGDRQSAGWAKLKASVAALAGSPDAPRTETRPRGNQRSICVIPFSNMSGEAEQEYFSDGISEDITTDLSKISALGVTARNTAFMFKGQGVDVCEIARRLGVSHVLEGSVRKVGDRVRITAQLIDGTTGEHAWAERYDRDLTDIFAIQDEISKSIVDALKVRLLPEEKRAIENRGTGDADAYNLYLMARQYWMTGDHGDSRREQRVIRICERATAIDPGYAQAWALMGLAQANLLYSYSGNEGLNGGLDAAEKALALDPTIAEARLPRIWHLALMGRNDEADSEIEIALSLGPDSWEVNREAARVFFRQGKVEGATLLLERAIELSETDFHSLGMLAAGYLAQGRADQSVVCAGKMIEQIEAALTRDPENGAAIAFGAMGFAILGELDRSREWIERGMLLDPDNLYMRYNLAWPLLKFFDDREGALELLEPALAKAGRNLISLAAADHNLDPLRDDPRFVEMLEAAKTRVEMAPGPVDRLIASEE